MSRSGRETHRTFRLSSLELLLLAVIVIGVAFMIRILVSPVSGSDRKLEDSVRRLEAQVQQLSGSPGTGAAEGGSAAGMPSPASLQPAWLKRIERLERRLDALERRCCGKNASPSTTRRERGASGKR